MNKQRTEAIEQCLEFMRQYKQVDDVNAKFQYEIFSRTLKQLAEMEAGRCELKKSQNLESKNTH